MSNSTDPSPLFPILRECGFSVSTAWLMIGSIDCAAGPSARSTDLARELLKWRRKAVENRLRKVRVRCQELLDEFKRNNQQLDDSPVSHDPYQLTLQDWLAEVARLSGGAGTDLH